MQFLNTLLLAAASIASLASAANTVEFVNQDNTIRHVVFTSQQDVGASKIKDLIVPGLGTASQTFPTGWIGNWFSYNEGQKHELGMLGEVRFDGWNGLVYFDVSAIVNSTDTEGVKMMYPKGQKPGHSSTPTSGCQTAICANRYNVWDDVATKATKSTELVCLLGNLAKPTERREAQVYPRSFVTGES